MNLVELLEVLRRTDEVTLLELLEISSEDLLDAFMDKVEENETKIRKAIANQ